MYDFAHDWVQTYVELFFIGCVTVESIFTKCYVFGNNTFWIDGLHIWVICEHHKPKKGRFPVRRRQRHLCDPSHARVTYRRRRIRANIVLSGRYRVLRTTHTREPKKNIV